MHDTYIRVYTQVQSVDSNCCCCCDTSSLHFTHVLFFFTLVLALPYVTLSKIGAHHPVQLRTTKKKEREKERVSTTP